MNTQIKIQQIYTNNSRIDGEIALAVFILEAEADGYNSSVYGEVKLNPADASHFIALNDTTEEMVAQWVKDALGDKVADYKRIAQERIDAQKNPLVSTKIPWEIEEIIEVPS